VQQGGVAPIEDNRTTEKIIIETLSCIYGEIKKIKGSHVKKTSAT